MWQAQHAVKLWEIAGMRNVEFSTTKCISKARKVNLKQTGGCEMTSSCSDHSRILLGSFWDHARSVRHVNDASSVSEDFCSDFGTSFFVAGAIFGDVGG